MIGVELNTDWATLKKCEFLFERNMDFKNVLFLRLFHVETQTGNERFNC